MTAALAQPENTAQGYQEAHKSSHSIPPMIKALFQDLTNIRMTALAKSPEMLPLLAPSLIEAEVHVRQLWASQY